MSSTTPPHHHQLPAVSMKNMENYLGDYHLLLLKLWKSVNRKNIDPNPAEM